MLCVGCEKCTEIDFVETTEQIILCETFIVVYMYIVYIYI